YTREAGVRGLKKQLSKIARVASEKVVSNSVEMPFKIKVSMLEDVLGKQRVRHEETNKENIPGVVTGLAWTPVGGEILFIEGTFMPGNGKLTLTGQLGSVMKESAQISMSLIRSRLANQLSGLNFTTSDIHIHVPSGSTPKDGPSAGVALFTSLASLALGKKVDAKLAMTGEITLRGAVTPVGGIKEKVIAAHRACVKRIILPKDNQRDLAEIPEEVKADLEFIFVSSVEEVIAYVFNIKLQMPSFKFEQTSADLAQDIGGV
ncbi:MAG: endopeptidase La, partial [Vallitaleaceae bacterium]|nr:endopeptidase La [Vallitaleaceae bacterium]